MKWPQAGSRANKLAAGVDGAPVAGSLDSDTAALVSLAARLRDIESPVISAEYSADLRLRLLEAAPDLIGSADAVISDVPRRPRRLRARTVRLSAATTAVVLAAGTGVGYASTSALPGGPLYPVKRTIEGVQLAVARSNLDKGHEHLDQASTRLTEVERLSDGYVSNYTQILIVDTLDDFSASAKAGATLLLRAYADNDQGRPMQILRDFNETSVAALDELPDGLPDEVQEEVVLAAVDVWGIDDNAVTECTDCAEPVVEIPDSLVTLAPEIVESGDPDIVTPTPETGDSSTTLSVTTVPGSLPAEVTPPFVGGPTVTPPGETAPAPTDVPPSVSGTAPAPSTEAPTPDPTPTPDLTPTPDATPTPDLTPTQDPTPTPDPSPTPDASATTPLESTAPLVSEQPTQSAPTSAPQLSADPSTDDQAPSSTVGTTVPPSGLLSDGSPRPMETSTAPTK